MKIAPGIYAGRYAIADEVQIWRIWFGFYHKRFRKTSGWFFIRLAEKDE